MSSKNVKSGVNPDNPKLSTSEDSSSQHTSSSTPTLNNLLRSDPGIQMQPPQSLPFPANWHAFSASSSATSVTHQLNGESSQSGSATRGFDARTTSSKASNDQYMAANGQGGPPPQMSINSCSPSINVALRHAHGVQVPSPQQMMGIPQHHPQCVPYRPFDVAQSIVSQQTSQHFLRGMNMQYYQQQRYCSPLPSGVIPAQYYQGQQQMPNPGNMPYGGFAMNRMAAPNPTSQVLAATIKQQTPQSVMDYQWSSVPKASQSEIQRASSGTPSAMERSPTATISSIVEDSLEDSKSPLSLPRTPAQQSQLSGGQRTPVSARSRTPAMSIGGKNREAIIEKLVSAITPNNETSIPIRQAFFEKLLMILDSKGETITQVPQVSKQPIDLHRLYFSVSNKGGFEQVTREKLWKQICLDVNPAMSDSSAAGYQLRRHYERFLLDLECFDTGRSMENMVAFTQRLKKKKRNEKESFSQQPFFGSPQQGGTQPGYGPHAGDPNTFYYPHVDVSMQGRAPHVWPSQASQAYPSGAQGLPVPPHPVAPPSYPSVRPMPPMRPPHPQQIANPVVAGSVEDQQRFEEQQRHFYQQQNAVQRAATPSTSLQDATQSRAASAGPQNESATPDSSSRLSAEDSVPHRPPSHARSITTPPSCTPSIPSQTTPMQQASQLPAHSGAYYGHSPQIAAQMYASQNLRVPNPAALQMKPPANMYPPGFQQPQTALYSGIHGYSDSGYQGQAHLGVPSAQQTYQQQMWMQQPMQRYPAHQPTASTSVVASAPSAMGSRQPNPDLSVMSVQQAGGYIVARRPNAYCMPPMHGMAHPSSSTHLPLRYNSPASNAAQMQAQQYSVMHHQAQQRYHQGTGPLMRPAILQAVGASGSAISSAQNNIPGSFPPPYVTASTSSSAGVHGPGMASHPANVAYLNVQQNTGNSAMVQHAQYQPSNLMQFPANSVEATVISQRKRRRIIVSEIYPKMNLKRILMSLRSEMLTEVTWAFNLLNAYLYDDHAAPLNLNHCPALLNILLDYFRAYLSLLLPQVFKLKSDSSFVKVDLKKLANEEKSLGKSSAMTVHHNDKILLKNNQKNYTKISRTGRTVHIEKKPMPEKLNQSLKEQPSTEFCSESKVNCLEQSVASKVREDICFKKYFRRFQRFSIFESRNKEDNEDEFIGSTSLSKLIEGEGGTTTDSSKSIIETIRVRASALSIRDETQMNVIRQCLAISNILRSFSFLLMNEAIMCRNGDLLFILGRLLRVMNVERAVKNESSTKSENTVCEGNAEMSTSSDHLDSDDDDALAIYEMSLQLRDDALLIISNLSVQLDLEPVNSCISWPIFDGLLHWCVSDSPDAKDIQSNVYMSPRDSSLEAICKMSVIQSNVDLLISTGPWQRIEKFVKILADLIDFNQETHIREFALIILTAICNASEPACYVVAAETRAIRNVLIFLDTMDVSMMNIAHQRGMNVLKDNPDMIGTSIGMLRRAASLFRAVSSVESCRKFLEKYQMRLVQFTTSQLMDSKVALNVSSVLYDICDKKPEVKNSVVQFASETVCDEKTSDTKGNDGNIVVSEKDDKKEEGKVESKCITTKKLKRSRSEDDSLTHIGKKENRDIEQENCRETSSESVEEVATKKRKLENGIVTLATIGKEEIGPFTISPLPKLLSNGEIIVSNLNKNQGTTNALQSVPASQRKTGVMENGTTTTSSAGSVQVVAS